MNNPQISIVIPTFNEADNIAPLVSMISDVLEPIHVTYELIYVDDSNDTTPDVIERIALEDEHVSLIHRPKERRTGLATAFLEGFTVAKAPYVFCMDGDLQHPPQLLPALLQELEEDGVGMVVASRFAKGGSDRGYNELHRRIFTKILQFMVWTILPATRKTSDPMTGFFAFKSYLVSPYLKQMHPLGFKILIEILVRVPNLIVRDIPLTFRERTSGISKASIKVAIAFLQQVIRLLVSTPK
jgi:dolichol-phosphate mannosyltransferase